MSSRTMRSVGWLAATATLVGLLVLAARRIDLVRAVAELHGVRAGWLVTAVLCFLAILPLWALEWRILAPRANGNTLRSMLGVVAITSSTLNTSAFFVGEAVAVLLLVARVGLTRAAALSVLAMDQLLVGIAKLVVLAAGALTLSLPQWMRAGVHLLGVGVVVLLTACMLAAWNHEAITPFAARMIPARLAAALGNMGESLAPLRSPSRSGSVLLLALAKKVVEVIAIVCVQRAFGANLPISSGILVLAALSLATLLPVVPGNLGVYEAAVVLTYTHLGIPAEQALGMAVVQHACYFAALALPGYAWLARDGVTQATAAAS